MLLFKSHLLLFSFWGIANYGLNGHLLEGQALLVEKILISSSQRFHAHLLAKSQIDERFVSASLSHLKAI